MRRILLPSLLAALVAVGSLSAASLDLGEVPFSVRRGFKLDEIATPRSLEAGTWLSLPPGPGRSLIVRDLDLPDIVRPSFLDFVPRSPEEFTFACVFPADLSLINKTGLAIKIPAAGQGWALYLNGVLVRNELFLGPGGKLQPERSLRNYIIPLDKRLLIEGGNVLAFRVFGDPFDERTGLVVSGGFLVGGYSDLYALQTEYLDIMLIGIYALFGLYHFILFALRPKNLSYLIYGVATAILSVFLFARTQSAVGLLVDTALIRHIDYSALFLLLPVFLAFFDTVLSGRVARFTKLALVLSLVFVPLGFFFRTEAVHNVWEIVTGLEILWVFSFVLMPGIVKAARNARGRPGARLLAAFNSGAGRLSFGAMLVAVAVVVDALAVNAGGQMIYSKYAFLILVLGAAALLAAQFLSVNKEVEALSKSLERKVTERSLELEAAVERQKALGAEIERNGKALAAAAADAERDLLVAEKVQRGLFPAEPPRVEGWDIALAYRPASGVSGDFYDFYVEEDRLEGLILGDVSGRGIGAGLVAVLARSVFDRRFEEFKGRPLGEYMEFIQGELAKELGGIDNYLTCLFLRLTDGKVEYANAAHPDLLLRRAGASSVMAILPKESGGFKGPPMGKEGFEGNWPALRFAPGSGDVLLAYTDCLEEATNLSGEAYGRERLEASLLRAPADTASTLMESLLSDLRTFVENDSLEDDLTVVVLKRA